MQSSDKHAAFGRHTIQGASEFAAAIPFLTVACTTLKNGAAISVTVFLVLLPASLLCYILLGKLKFSLWGTGFFCTMVSLMLAALSTYVIRYIAPEITDALGIYLYLTAAFGLVASVFRGGEPASVGSSLWWAVRYAGFFAVCAVVISGVRELLAFGQLWGIPMGSRFVLAGASLPFFGFVLVGLLLALSRYVRRMLYVHRHMFED